MRFFLLLFVISTLLPFGKADAQRFGKKDLPPPVTRDSLIEKYSEYGTLIYLKCENSVFPDDVRNFGYTYNGKKFPAAQHYSDSTVAVFIPKYYNAGRDVDILIHFHGWYNNVDSVLQQFELIEQLYESEKNAILIIPEVAKNAPDSYGGKMERKNGFKKLIKEVLDSLKARELIKNSKPGDIIISGHSGAYRAISYILLWGGLIDNIKELYLFDGMYGHLERYTYWLDHYPAKFINVYASDTGTRSETERMVENFSAWDFDYMYAFNEELTPEILEDHRIIIIYTNLAHEDVIHKSRNLYKFLMASCFD
jgi:hypothetical protein